MKNGSSPDPINMDFGPHLPKEHMGLTQGMLLGNVRLRLPNLDVATSKEPGKDVRIPGGLCGRLLGKNEILVARNQGLSDYEVKVAFRRSKIVATYHFRDEI